MYKRRLRLWGLRKNNPPGTRGKRPPVAPRGDRGASNTPRYLAQNDIDEVFHTLLDFFVPWATQAQLLWARSARMHCPPRAAYVYDTFTCGIAAAVVAFENGDARQGGAAMRQAFLDLEHTLAPASWSMYTLPSLFFALATLNLAGHFEASRLLVLHASKFILARMQTTTNSRQDAHHQLPSDPGPGEGGDWGGHVSHPLPQIVYRLQVLNLKGDGTTMRDAIFRAWSAYQRRYSAELGGTIASHSSARQFWNVTFNEFDLPLSHISGGIPGWTNSIQPVLHCLDRIRDYAESCMDDELILLNLEETVSLYSFSRDERLEQMALSTLAKIDGQESRAAQPAQWRCLIAVELAKYYAVKGETEGVIRSFSRIIPNTMGKGWEDPLINEYQSWTQKANTNINAGAP